MTKHKLQRSFPQIQPVSTCTLDLTGLISQK